MVGRTVLLVENETILRECIHDLLIDNGFITIEATTADSACMLLEQICPDLLLTDINMPGRLDGTALAQLARYSHPNLPVIFITGSPEAAFSARRFSPPSLVFHKPFKFDALLAAVAELTEFDGDRPMCRDCPVAAGAVVNHNDKGSECMGVSNPFAECIRDPDVYCPIVDAINGYAIYTYDSTGTIVSWSHGAQRLKGYEASEVLGRNFSIFYTDEDRKAGLPHHALEISKARGSFKTEGWHVRKDGSRFWAYVKIAPVLDTVGDFINITLDLTPRKRAADASQQSQDQFDRFDESLSNCAIYQLDETGHVMTWNAGAETIYGFSSDEIIGQDFSLFYTAEGRSSGAPHRDLDIAARDGRFETEAWRIRKNGELFWAHALIDTVRDRNGRTLGFVKIARDLTLVKNAALAAEAARAALLQSQKMETIGRLAGGVAHDFNNLLTVVLGGLEIIQNRLPSDPKISTLLENAIQAAHRGRILTRRLLGFARRQDLEPEEIDLAQLVSGMFDLLRHTLGPFVTVETGFPSDLPKAVADPNQLELAILNLATNARDAMPNGGSISITANRVGAGAGHCARLDDAEHIRLSIADSGEGMDAATLDQANEPFFTTKEIGRGTGLGVPMVRGFAEQSGGCFSLKSSPGQGTVAEIWLPAANRRALIEIQASGFKGTSAPSPRL